MIYIPIGEDCFSTKYLNKHGLRTFATIFDWVIICPEDILRLFKNDFQDFLLKENLQFLRKSRVSFRHKDIEVMETNYNILIPHHFNIGICHLVHKILSTFCQLIRLFIAL